jgi:hypothetical protein
MIDLTLNCAICKLPLKWYQRKAWDYNESEGVFERDHRRCKKILYRWIKEIEESRR